MTLNGFIAMLHWFKFWPPKGLACKDFWHLYSTLSLSLSVSLITKFSILVLSYYYSVLLLLLSFVVPLGCVVTVSRTGGPKGIRA